MYKNPDCHRVQKKYNHKRFLKVRVQGKQISKIFCTLPSPVSSLHTDNKDNLFVQIKGAKLFKLIHPRHKIEPIDGVMFNSSKFNPEAYTGSEIEIDTVVVEPGDMLYIPKLYWHYVRSLSASISISMWF